MLVSEDYARFYKEFSNDLQDAKAATRLALARAPTVAEHTAEELAQLQQRAIVIANGQRVGFRRR